MPAPFIPLLIRGSITLLGLAALTWGAATCVQDLRAFLLLEQGKSEVLNFNFEGGLATVGQAITLVPYQAEAHLYLANTYRALSLYRDPKLYVPLARASYLEAARHNRSSAFVFYEFSLLYSQLNRFIEALEPIEQSLLLERNNAGYWLEKGRILEGAGQVTSARQAYIESNRLQPNEESKKALERFPKD